MNITELREECATLRAEVLRRKAAHREEDGAFCPWRAVLDIGDVWRNSQPRGPKASYARMIKHMKKTYGEVAALIMLLGKADEQIRDGSVADYFKNGYASEEKGSRFEFQWKDASMHMLMLRLLEDNIVNRGVGGKPVQAIRDLLVEILIHLEEYTDELKDIVAIGCERCLNNPPELHTEDLDGEWEKLNVRETLLPIVRQILSE